MKHYHPNSNKRYRQRLKQVCQRLLRNYPKIIQPEQEIDHHVSHPLSNVLVLYRNDGNISTLTFPFKVGNGKVVAYKGHLTPTTLCLLF